mmetsp:Transcript_10792/g.37214  ORF Transcript_10792/g.37214 Transcript_10792/m.37214 type:complete len:426 (-) Transcript_10792:405-1682(-)
MDSLSEDALSIVSGWLFRKELLVVRALSRTGRSAVQLAVRSQCKCRTCTLSEFMPDKSGMSVEKAAALGRVFGGGCRSLHIYLYNDRDASEDTKTMLLEATRAFHETIAPPGLEELHIQVVMPEKMLLEICGANPRMVTLSINTGPLPRSVLASVGLVCPLLTRVHLSTGGLCEAEAYAMHFPRLETLRFGVRGEGTQSNRYIIQPAGLKLIEESAARCVEATGCDFDECVVTPALAECVLRSSLPSRVTYLNLYCSQVTMQTVLAFAASFQNLTSLLLPPTFAVLPFDSDDREYGSPEFYEAIWRARPTITEMDVSYADGADLEVVCRLFPLKNLTVTHHTFEFGSTTLVDIILASPCRDTLIEVGISCTSATEVLRLITTLENVKEFYYNDMTQPDPDEPEPDSDEIFDRIDHIMKSRGGRCY